MRIELNKFTRGGFLGKNTSDYYKRMGLLNTPGTKLAIQGDLKDPSYGMMPTYKALVIKDFNYVDVEGAQQVVENLKDEVSDMQAILQKGNSLYHLLQYASYNTK